MGIRVDASGPVFDGRAQQAAADFCDAALEAVTEHAKGLVDAELVRVLRHPTGYYQSKVRAERVAANRSRVHDSGVIYGPWLEGVGSRNYPETRFRGYSHWRRMKRQAQADALPVAERVLATYLSRMR